MSLISNWLRELKISAPSDPSLFFYPKPYIDYSPEYVEWGNLIYTGHFTYIHPDVLRIAYPLGN